MQVDFRSGKHHWMRKCQCPENEKQQETLMNKSQDLRDFQQQEI